MSFPFENPPLRYGVGLGAPQSSRSSRSPPSTAPPAGSPWIAVLDALVTPMIPKRAAT